MTLFIWLLVIIVFVGGAYWLSRHNPTFKAWVIGLGAAIAAGAVAFWQHLPGIAQ